MLQVQWDKGSALLHLLEVLQLHQEPDVVSVYIGDDKTDEDAFQALTNSGAGWGILVSTKVKPTAAAYTVQDPSQVQAFLDLLVQYGCTGANGWMQYKGQCPGWAPRPQQRAQQQGSQGQTPGPDVAGDGAAAEAAAGVDAPTAAPKDAGGGSDALEKGVPAAAAAAAAGVLLPS
jgi:trehalose 6-phosphate phosphatase